MINNTLNGLYLSLAASLWWGIIGVIYFKFVSFATPIELVAHRTVWTAFLLLITTFFFSKWTVFLKVVENKKKLFLLFLSGSLVMANWLTWLYAVSVNRLVDASLGYFIFPIFSIFFGIVFFKESYNNKKIFSVILVFFSIIYLILYYKTLPWIGLSVAVSFSLYSLIRKKLNIDSDIALLVETLLLTPFALLAFYYLVKLDLNIFSLGELKLSFYLLWAGPITLIPLYLYAKGFQLVGIGPASMIFFITPTSQFLLGILLYEETLDIHKLFSFLIIWIAVFIYLNELRKE